MRRSLIAARWIVVLLMVSLAVSSCSRVPREGTGGGTPGPTAAAPPAQQGAPVLHQSPGSGQGQPAPAAGASGVQKSTEAKEQAEGKEVELTEANFDETVSKKGTVVLVDFWAPWCGPCREQGPIVEDIAKDYAGRAVVGKVNVDENEPLARRFGIEAIPTLIVFKDGKEVARKVGLTEKKELAAMLDRALGK